MRVDLDILANKIRLENYPDLGCYIKKTDQMIIYGASELNVLDGCVTEEGSLTDETALTAWLSASELKKFRLAVSGSRIYILY